MSTEHNWPEDFSHENGNYNNDCYICKTVFIGHKRRVVCRVCATPQSIRDQLAHLQSQLDECRKERDEAKARLDPTDADKTLAKSCSGPVFSWEKSQAIVEYRAQRDGEVDMWKDQLRGAREQLAALLAEVESLRADKERLGWTGWQSAWTATLATIWVCALSSTNPTARTTNYAQQST
jgi:hypothetical protein